MLPPFIGLRPYTEDNMKPRSEWEPGEEIPLEQGDMPLIFAFRAKSFQVVAPDRVEEWEQLMTERVGIKPGWNDTQEQKATRTFCQCDGGLSGFDDCDAI